MKVRLRKTGIFLKGKKEQIGTDIENLKFGTIDTDDVGIALLLTGVTEHGLIAEAKRIFESYLWHIKCEIIEEKEGTSVELLFKKEK